MDDLLSIVGLLLLLAFGIVACDPLAFGIVACDPRGAGEAIGEFEAGYSEAAQ